MRKLSISIPKCCFNGGDASSQVPHISLKKHAIADIHEFPDFVWILVVVISHDDCIDSKASVVDIFSRTISD